ncbi:hypothetical protein B0H14DRAFT_3498201 [Mycena olivaceomarginata]|nr:hypothetical protein B0H14DRAFT_3498201 [Mycena olivaceomarginata]
MVTPYTRISGSFLLTLCLLSQVFVAAAPVPSAGAEKLENNTAQILIQQVAALDAG